MISFKICFIFFVGTAGIALGQQPFELSFIHLNDFHARFEPTSISSKVCPPGDNELGRCYGGIARVVTAMKSLQSTVTNPVLLNAGDSFQGSFLYSYFKWNITLEFMNRIAFDATALGNHEFDDSIAGLEPYMSGLNSPIVAANMDASLEPALLGKYHPSIVIQRGGRNIGIIGCVTKYTPSMASTSKVIFNDELETVRAEAARLRTQGVDIIVLLSHSGYDVDQELAKNITDLDIIVGGHTHSFLYTGLLQVEFDAQGEIITWSGAPIMLNASVPEDPETKAALQPWIDEANVKGQVTIGTTAVKLDYSNYQCFYGECSIGNFYADAMVVEQIDIDDLANGWTKAAIGIMNPGAIRGPLGSLSSNITYNDLMTSQPFANTIDTIELQGKDLLEMFEMPASNAANIKDFTTGLGTFQVSGK
ncbi:hypothetical protein B566_EDAN012170 [Ephemera danica]|nr:hypothetical protein B566_EDAN012170 [Ephemera danica]